MRINLTDTGKTHVWNVNFSQKQRKEVCLAAVEGWIEVGKGRSADRGEGD